MITRRVGLICGERIEFIQFMNKEIIKADRGNFGSRGPDSFWIGSTEYFLIRNANHLKGMRSYELQFVGTFNKRDDLDEIKSTYETQLKYEGLD